MVDVNNRPITRDPDGVKSTPAAKTIVTPVAEDNPTVSSDWRLESIQYAPDGRITIQLSGVIPLDADLVLKAVAHRGNGGVMRLETPEAARFGPGESTKKVVNPLEICDCPPAGSSCTGVAARSEAVHRS